LLQNGNNILQLIWKERTILTENSKDKRHRFFTEDNLMMDLNEEHLGASSKYPDPCLFTIIPDLRSQSYLAMMVQHNSPYAEILNYQ
jgi:hypothetical protein